MTSISIIVPFTKVDDALIRCVASLRSLDPKPNEIILINDGIELKKKDAELLRDFKVFPNEQTQGPSGARNQGAAKSTSMILCFIDSDVQVPADLLHDISTEFQNNANAAALFGSYDNAPGHQNFLSQYKNLFHHFVHQNSRREASTFWTGCGAVKRHVFQEMKGFNEQTAWVEDVEFGIRLIKSGHKVLLVKEIQVKHWKKWTLVSLIVSDIFHRAIPWTRFAMAFGGIKNDLNTTYSARISASAVTLAILLAGVFAQTPFAAISTFVLLGIALSLNFSFYLFMYRQRGFIFALGSILWHWFYFVYSSIALMAGIILAFTQPCKTI